MAIMFVTIMAIALIALAVGGIILTPSKKAEQDVKKTVVGNTAMETLMMQPRPGKMNFLAQQKPMRRQSAQKFPNGATVSTVTANGRKVKAVVVGFSRRGYALKNVDHPMGGAFRRKLAA